MVDGGMVKEEFFTLNQTVNAGDSTAVGCCKIDNNAFLSRIFSGS